ncbi:DNA cytosine methyltransferase [Capnocytophaga canimorsus]|uniref:DNA cytosine methyltransferase n=1 Tax=Capnocytophaga canimorsus TaxID=28188 RepID=UPI0015627CEF|nr:DNA cytosine methyltransferase [Capnocytophaga canimorsus]
MKTNAIKYKAIDFFCGGGGMTYGLRQAGINVIAGVDFDGDAKDTYEYNNPSTVFIQTNIKDLSSNYFELNFNLQKNDDNLILVGCSPCQFYSIIHSDKSKSFQSKDLLMDFARFVEYYSPGYVLVENVPGILTHKDSILPAFLEKLKEIGYNNIVYKVVDMSYYGVPQSRRRFSLIATRLKNVNIDLPIPEKKSMLLREAIGSKNGFSKIKAGHKDKSDFNHSVAGLSEKGLQRMKKTQHDGGSRLDWANDPELQLKCFIGKDNSFKDTYGRMWWDKPSPTITTKFFSISNGRFGHPEEDRAISIREGATIQTFPKNYVFKTGSIAATAKLIGNAVPPEYAKRVGLSIINNQ